jgi:hypothetical protein
MTKKTFNIVVGVLTAVSTAAVALVPIIWPTKVQVISSAITIVFGAAIEICSLFTEEAVVEKGGKEEGA